MSYRNGTLIGGVVGVKKEVENLVSRSLSKIGCQLKIFKCKLKYA
jgi:hypothetical protein